MPASVVQRKMHPVPVGQALLSAVRAARRRVFIVIQARFAHGWGCGPARAHAGAGARFAYERGVGGGDIVGNAS